MNNKNKWEKNATDKGKVVSHDLGFNCLTNLVLKKKNDSVKEKHFVMKQYANTYKDN